MAEKIEVAERDVRYVIEPILTLSSPSEHYGAHIEVYKRGPRGGSKRYVRLGPRMIADTVLEALGDLRRAMYADVLPGVRVLMEDQSSEQRADTPVTPPLGETRNTTDDLR